MARSPLWIVGATRIPMLMQFAHTMKEHRKGILAYYDYRIFTGPLEGTDTKIQAIKRQAYGFRDHEFFKLKILAIHQAKYALSDEPSFCCFAFE